eukprot:9391426-Pyramimonas_sp.AAC.2
MGCEALPPQQCGLRCHTWCVRCSQQRVQSDDEREFSWERATAWSKPEPRLDDLVEAGIL